MQRIATGLTLAVVWSLLLLRGPFYGFALALFVLGALGLREYAALAFGPSAPRFRLLTVVLGLLPLLGACSGRVEGAAAGLTVALLLLFAYTVVNYAGLENGLDFMARLGLGLLYPGFCLAHLLLLMARESGGTWLLILTVITVASDSGAYYCGRAFGKRKLCPAVSPGKTLAGLVGGLLAGMAAAVLAARFLFPGAAASPVAAAALLLAALGVVGDLAESVLKRSAGVKDSGGLLPGHGGLLDRGDSILVAAPVFFYLLHFGVV